MSSKISPVAGRRAIILALFLWSVGIPTHAATVVSSAVMFESPSALSLPVPPTHSEWTQRLGALGADATGKLHGIWTYPPSYRNSVDDGRSWSSPEQIASTNVEMQVSPDGTVDIMTRSFVHQRRLPTGEWVSEQIAGTIAEEMALARGSDGTLSIAYTTVSDDFQSRPLYVRSRDPATGVWSSPDLVTSSSWWPINDFRISENGTPWLGLRNQVWHRTPSGWIGESVDDDVFRMGALAETQSGSLIALYWKSGTGASNLWLRLEWASRETDGPWVEQGPVRDRATFWVRDVRTARSASGHITAVWDECAADYIGFCHAVAAKLPAGSATWTSHANVTAYPRADTRLTDITLVSSGLAVVAGDSDYLSGGWISREGSNGQWTDAPAGDRKEAAGAPATYGVEVTEGLEDGIFAAWSQEVPDGLEPAPDRRIPHVVFGYRDRSGQWSTPEIVDTGTPWRAPPTTGNWFTYFDHDVVGVAGSSRGDAYVIWRDYSELNDDYSPRDRLLGRYRDASGQWGAVEVVPYWQLTSSLFNTFEARPEMIFDSDGSLWVLNGVGAEYKRSADGTWSTEPSLPNPSVVSVSPRLAIAPDGSQYAAWEQYTGQNGAILLARRVPPASWSLSANRA